MWFSLGVFLILDNNITVVKQIEDLFSVILWQEIQKHKPSFHFNYFLQKIAHLSLQSSPRETVLGTGIFCYHSVFLYSVQGFLLILIWFLVMASDRDRTCPCWWEMRQSFEVIILSHSLWANSCLQVCVLLLNLFKGCSSFMLCVRRWTLWCQSQSGC